MLHLLLYGVLAIALAGALFAVAARFLPAGEQIAPSVRDEPPWELPPEHTIRAEDVDAVRLPVALRGYRFAETDLLLDRLAGELRARDAQIAQLRGEVVPSAVDPHGEKAAAHVEPGGKLVEVVVSDEHLEEELAVADALGEPPSEIAPQSEPAGEPEPGTDAAEPAAGSEPAADPEPASADPSPAGAHSAPDAAQSYPTPDTTHPDYAHAAQPPADPAEHWTASAPPWAVPVSTAVDEPAAEPEVADQESGDDGGGRRGQRRRRRRT